jgi:hypothetical protein
VHGCLKKSPDERFQSFADIRHALAAILQRIEPGYDPRR